MRPLTAEEKARSKEARKWANKVLRKRRRTSGERLLDVKGLPAILKINDLEIVIDYELFQRYLRKLKKRHWTMKMTQSSGGRSLIINHYVDVLSKDRGSIELYELPGSQRELLKDLPIVEI
ncbi:hypothetical protein [Paenibacillus sp. GM2]|uniref:hypothetical protein n=1 Tax=Paenibacillus sp. GM2 TaxID=1622070 RepID=UPI00083853F4|nr:hypothetical protein [Paenibacillus sp. GM2]